MKANVLQNLSVDEMETETVNNGSQEVDSQPENNKEVTDPQSGTNIPVESTDSNIQIESSIEVVNADVMAPNQPSINNETDNADNGQTMGQGGGDDDPYDPRRFKKRLIQGHWNPMYLSQIVSVMDRYCISHDAYHGLQSILQADIPSIYLVKEQKNEMTYLLDTQRDVQVTCSKFIWKK